MGTMGTLADAAGEVMRAGLGSPSRLKADGSPVTDDDETLNALVIAMVTERHPDCAVIGEEESWFPSGDRATAMATGGTFVVDPIDGTGTYTIGLGLATFAMAYLHDGELLAAVVDDPFASQRFTAQRGRGAMCNSTRAHVGDVPRSNLVIIEGVRPALRPDWSAELSLRNAGFTLARLRAFIGPSVRVATGALAATVLARPSLHDCAPVALVVAEAGGVVTDLSGRPWQPATHDGLVAAHPSVHPELLELVAAGRVPATR